MLRLHITYSDGGFHTYYLKPEDLPVCREASARPGVLIVRVELDQV